jgi:hypothetical protein
MKSTVEQLIEEMQNYSYKISKEGNLDMVAAFNYAIDIAKKYKGKEKEQLQQYFEYGIEAAEDYYNKKETQKQHIIDIMKADEDMMNYIN